MKSLFLIAITLFLFNSCGSNEEAFVEENSEKEITKDTLISPIPVYQSKIRGNVDVGQIYTDTLTFLSFDSNYDYWFCLFQTRELDTVYMAYNDLVEEVNAGRIFIVQWKVDSLFEAGEGDELYFQERIISYDVIRDLEKGFEKFLNVFVADFVNPSSDMLQYIQPDISFQSSNNLGLYCTLVKSGVVEKHAWLNGFETSVFENTPEGHFCDGYPGIQNGFYYTNVLLKDLPAFDKMEKDDFIVEKYDIPEEFSSNEFMKITMIKDEYHLGYLFFIQVENKWYFFAQDLCDCSA